MNIRSDGNRELRFQFDGSQLSENELVDKAISAVFELNSNSFKLHTMDLHLAMADIYSMFPHSSEGLVDPYYLFLSPSKPETIEVMPNMIGQKVTELIDFSENLLKKTILMCQTKERELNNDDTLIPVWSELMFRGISVKIPEKYVHDEVVPLQYGSRIQSCKVYRDQNDYWIHAPQAYSNIDPPIQLFVQNECGNLKLTVQMAWSYFWKDHHFEGAELMREYLEKLCQKGWTVDP